MPLEWLTKELVTNLQKETTVEDQLIMPLFTELGYNDDDRERAVAIEYMQGNRRGRKPEADFVYYDGPDHSPDNSLVTVEAKAVGEDLDDAANQADFYNWILKTPLYVACNGREIVCMQVQVSRANVEVFRYDVADLPEKWAQVESVLSKEAVVAYARKLQFKPIRTLDIDFTAYLETAMADSAARVCQSVARRVVLSQAIFGSRRGWIGDGVNEAQQVTLNDALAEEARLVILGDAGYGKTHSLHSGFVELARARLDDVDAALPILVDLNAGGGSTTRYGRTAPWATAHPRQRQGWPQRSRLPSPRSGGPTA